jgi:hypothetical protein
MMFVDLTSPLHAARLWDASIGGTTHDHTTWHATAHATAVPTVVLRLQAAVCDAARPTDPAQREAPPVALEKPAQSARLGGAHCFSGVHDNDGALLNQASAEIHNGGDEMDLAKERLHELGH